MSGIVGSQEMKTKFSPRDINARQLSAETKGAVSRVPFVNTRNWSDNAKCEEVKAASLVHV